MAAVYTKRFLSVDLAVGTGASAVVPAGRVWVLRNVIAVCDTGAAQMVAAIYGPFPHTLAIAVQPANVTQTYNVETRVVLNAGDELRAIAVAGQTWHITCTGYDFAA